MSNDKVKYEVNGQVKELSFEHALSLFRQISKNKGGVLPKIVSNHEFINNELNIRPGKGDSTKSPKPKRNKKGGKVSKSVKDSNESL